MLRRRRARRRETVLLGGRRDRLRSRSRRLALYGLAVLTLLLAASFGGAHLLTGRSTFARTVAWRESDIGDIRRFPALDTSRRAGQPASAGTRTDQPRRSRPE